MDGFESRVNRLLDPATLRNNVLVAELIQKDEEAARAASLRLSGVLSVVMSDCATELQESRATLAESLKGSMVFDTAKLPRLRGDVLAELKVKLLAECDPMLAVCGLVDRPTNVSAALFRERLTRQISQFDTEYKHRMAAATAQITFLYSESVLWLGRILESVTRISL